MAIKVIELYPGDIIVFHGTEHVSQERLVNLGTTWKHAIERACQGEVPIIFSPKQYDINIIRTRARFESKSKADKKSEFKGRMLRLQVVGEKDD